MVSCPNKPRESPLCPDALGQLRRRQSGNLGPGPGCSVAYECHRAMDTLEHDTDETLKFIDDRKQAAIQVGPKYI